MSKSKNHNIWLYLVFGIIIVLVIWLVCLIWIDRNIGICLSEGEKFARQGQFGDKFGAINSIFSALAFAGILGTLYFQSFQLSEARSDLADNNILVMQQNFSNYLFNSINTHLSLVNNLKIDVHDYKMSENYSKIDYVENSNNLVSLIGVDVLIYLETKSDINLLKIGHIIESHKFILRMINDFKFYDEKFTLEFNKNYFLAIISSSEKNIILSSELQT